MSKLDITVPHELPEHEALNRIKKMLGELKESQKNLIENVREEWHGNNGHFSFTAKGFKLSGTIEVGFSNVNIHAELPFALSFFKSKITEVIRDKTTELLS